MCAVFGVEFYFADENIKSFKETTKIRVIVFTILALLVLLVLLQYWYYNY